uniref:Uncharacterized protein n=1 Tax=Aegilops tauschii subsp. strangulata TaxID=200361 RepID=A0A453F9I3_AEGTS
MASWASTGDYQHRSKGIYFGGFDTAKDILVPLESPLWQRWVAVDDDAIGDGGAHVQQHPRLLKEETCVGARVRLPYSGMQRTVGTATKKMTVTPRKMKRKLLRRPMAMELTQTGTLTVVLPTTSPTNSRR